KHTKTFPEARTRVRPVISALDGNHAREESIAPGDFVHAADDEHDLVQLGGRLARQAYHLVGNVHANHAACGYALSEQATEPAGSTAHIEHVFDWRKMHPHEHRQRDRQGVTLHAFPTPGLTPAHP